MGPMRGARRILLLALAGAAAGDGADPSAIEGFEALRSILENASKKTLDRYLPPIPAQFEDSVIVVEDPVDARRRFAREITDAVARDVRQAGRFAVVRYSGPGDDVEREVPLLLAPSQGWKIQSPQGYAVAGKAIERARGGKPARVHLVPRVAADSYGESGVSFMHVTTSPDRCANRIDVWLCKQRELHVVPGCRIADLGEGTLEGVRGLPVEWPKSFSPVRPTPGRVCVVHCYEPRVRDFFVAFRVVDAQETGVELEWTLLGAGPGSPDSIHQPTRPARGMPALPCVPPCGRRD